MQEKLEQGEQLNKTLPRRVWKAGEGAGVAIGSS
jgi:hypothetical protein